MSESHGVAACEQRIDAVDAPSGRWKVIEKLLQTGWSLVMASGLVVFSRDRFSKLFSPSWSPEYFSLAMGVVLLLIVIMLVFRYVYAVSGEMRLFHDYLEAQIPAIPGQVFLWTTVFSILLGTMGYFSNNIVVFASMFVFFCVGDLWGQALRDRHLRQMLATARKNELPELRRRALAVIEDYYLGRPQLHRSATLMFFGFVGLLLGVGGQMTTAKTAKPWLQCASHVVIIVSIIVNELVMYRWRRVRDKALETGEIYSV